MSNQEMSVEERNLISVAYKNAVGSRRASWRIISSVEQKEASKGNEQNVEMAKAYRIRVEAELNKICGEILELIDTNLVPMSTAGESKVFYFKMKGDYYRYIAEFTEGEGKAGAANSAHGVATMDHGAGPTVSAPSIDPRYTADLGEEDEGSGGSRRKE